MSVSYLIHVEGVRKLPSPNTMIRFSSFWKLISLLPGSACSLAFKMILGFLVSCEIRDNCQIFIDIKVSVWLVSIIASEF